MLEKYRGAYTVEAVIVMSSILFILFVMVSAFLLLYQNAIIHYVATQAAQQGAIRWTDATVDMEGREAAGAKQGLYYRLGEFGGGENQKTAEIERWAEQKLSALVPNTFVGNGRQTVHVTFDNTFFQRFVVVDIRKEINIPFQKIAEYFNADLNLHVKVRACVSEPAEYIRNIDYAKDIGEELWPMVSGKLKPILDGLR